MTLRVIANSNSTRAGRESFLESHVGRTQRENENVHWKPGVMAIISMLGLRTVMLIPGRPLWNFSENCCWNILAENLRGFWKQPPQSKPLKTLWHTVWPTDFRKTWSGCRVGDSCLSFQRLSCLKIQEGISDPWRVEVEGHTPRSKERGAVILSEYGSVCPRAQPSLGVI